MTVWSFSRLETAEKCPKQYRFRYIDHAPKDGEGVEAFMGKVVHSIVVRTVHHVARHGAAPTLGQLVSGFHAEWKSQRAALSAKGTKLLVAKRNMSESDYETLGERCVQNFYRRSAPFSHGSATQAKVATVGLEYPLNFTVGGIPFVGFIDRLDRGDTAYGSWFRIADYKTSAKPKSQAEVDRDEQLALYEIGLRQTYPDAAGVHLTWEFLQVGVSLDSKRTAEQREELEADVAARVRMVEDSDDYPANPSPLCAWCIYRSRCPEGGGR